MTLTSDYLMEELLTMDSSSALNIRDSDVVYLLRLVIPTELGLVALLLK